MVHLLEHKDFGTEKEFQDFIRRYKSTGYISSSMEKSLERITGVPGIWSQLNRKSEELISFFRKFNLDFVDDKLFEIFEENYNYQPHLGISLDRPFYWPGYSTSNYSLFPSDLNIYNKDEFLFFLIDFIFSRNQEAQKVSKTRLDDWRKKGHGKFFLGSRNFNPENFFKSISHIQPTFVITCQHKNYAKYWELDWDDRSCVNDWNGFLSQDLWEYANPGDKGLVGSIKKRIIACDRNIKKITCQVKNTNYTDSYFYEEDPENPEELRRVVNPNPILLSCLFIIGIDLSDFGTKYSRWEYHLGR